MILAVSRFRVANGMEGAVNEAFLDRPRLVDSAPGFLGMETFTDSGDGAVFYLVTRWSDESSFRSWHNSADHRLSHKFIPKGLKLDPSFTKVVVLSRLVRGDSPGSLEESVADAAPFITRYLESSPTLHYLAARPDGTVVSCSSAVTSGLKISGDHVVGRPLWTWLTEGDAASLQARIAQGGRFHEPFLLNFSDSANHPYTLECRLDVHPDGFVLIGETPLDKEHALRDELLGLNNQLATMTRENARQNKALKRSKVEMERMHEELAKAHEDLKNSHWHLKKISEVLPICMYCGKVKTGESEWQGLINYFKEHSDFLSHSYCPECYAAVMEQYGLKDKLKESK